MAFAFYSRIVKFAEHHDRPAALILAHVIAHEIGHLLLPDRPNGPTGIMSGRWGREQVADLDRGWVRFTQEETEAIRKTTHVRNAN